MSNQDRQSGFDVLAPLILLILLGAIGAGVAFYTWQQRIAMQARAEALAARVREEEARKVAIVAREEAERTMDRERALRADAPQTSSAPGLREVVIAIDVEGNLSIDGENVTADRLEIAISEAQDTYLIQVADDCRFEHLAGLLALFEELGREQPRIVAESQ